MIQIDLAVDFDLTVGFDLIVDFDMRVSLVDLTQELILTSTWALT